MATETVPDPGEAVEPGRELELLGELVALLAAEYGPVPERALAEARDRWPDRVDAGSLS